MNQARELREQRAKLVTDAQALIPDKGTMDAETRSKFDKMIADSDEMLKDIERIEKAEQLTADIRSATAPPKDKISNPTASVNAKEAHNRAFRSYLYNGPVFMDRDELRTLAQFRASAWNLRVQGDAEFRDMGSGGGNALQGTGGGYFVPVGFVQDVEIALKYYGPMLKAATIMPTATGQPLPYPTANDTTVSGALVGEGAQVSTADVTLGNIVFGAYKYTTNMVKVSIELLQDSAFDLEKFLKDQFAIRLGRILNTHFTVGTGSSQPNGIITAGTAGPTAVGSSSNDGSSNTGTNSFGSDDLVALEHSVDPLYRQGSAFMMHDASLQFAKQLKDKYGRPLWRVSVAGGEPDTINGYPYWVNNDMAQIAASAKTILFGRIDKYMIRQVKELAVIRLDERFADFGQVAFLGFARYDGQLLDAGTHPVKYLVQHS